MHNTRSKILIAEFVAADLFLLVATYGTTCRSMYFLVNWISDCRLIATLSSPSGGEDRRKMQKWMNKIESPRGGSEGKLSLTGIKMGVKVPFDRFPQHQRNEDASSLVGETLVSRLVKVTSVSANRNRDESAINKIVKCKRSPRGKRNKKRNKRREEKKRKRRKGVIVFGRKKINNRSTGAELHYTKKVSFN